MLDRQSMTWSIDNAESTSGIMGNERVLSVWLGDYRARCSGFLTLLTLYDSMLLTSGVLSLRHFSEEIACNSEQSTKCGAGRHRYKS